jgi:hypothetical protein
LYFKLNILKINPDLTLSSTGTLHYTCDTFS